MQYLTSININLKNNYLLPKTNVAVKTLITTLHK